MKKSFAIPVIVVLLLSLAGAIAYGVKESSRANDVSTQFAECRAGVAHAVNAAVAWVDTAEIHQDSIGARNAAREGAERANQQLFEAQAPITACDVPRVRILTSHRTYLGSRLFLIDGRLAANCEGDFVCAIT